MTDTEAKKPEHPILARIFGKAWVCRRFGHQAPWTFGFDPRLNDYEGGFALAGCDYCGAHNVPRSGRSGL